MPTLTHPKGTHLQYIACHPIGLVGHLHEVTPEAVGGAPGLAGSIGDPAAGEADLKMFCGRTKRR